ncbi:hypothetical protein BKA70DRAFT_1520916 [Coprinopsis sp. MPI-PUGE-AT-0042]|nr:hypothetical protein BKA70DRAFT_1520916 [Coprinopsis sp. MPI-PUGE-AT-0042]
MTTIQVELIWPDRWNLMKILFILNRYGSLVATLFAYTLEAATKSTSFRLCRAGVISQGMVIGLNLSWSETLLFMRVYALSGSNRYVGAFLCTLWTGIFCGITINFYYTTKVVEFLEFPWPGQACLAKPIANTLRLGFPFFVILAEQAVVMVLCIYYGLNKHWSSRSRLARTFSRDGTYYFIAISIMSVANVAFNLAFPGKFQHYFGPAQGVVQSALASRLVLHLRQKANDAPVVNSILLKPRSKVAPAVPSGVSSELRR